MMFQGLEGMAPHEGDFHCNSADMMIVITVISTRQTWMCHRTHDHTHSSIRRMDIDLMSESSQYNCQSYMKINNNMHLNSAKVQKTEITKQLHNIVGSSDCNIISGFYIACRHRHPISCHNYKNLLASKNSYCD